MRTTMDGAGRVVIPKELRERAGFQPGVALEIVERDGRIEIEPPSAPMRLARRDGVLVAVTEESLPPLTDEMVRDTLERVRR